MNMHTSLSFFSVLIVSLCAFTFYKVRKVHLQQFELFNTLKSLQINLDATYQQIQSFITLEKRLNLAFGLPPLRGWTASPDFLLTLLDHADLEKPTIIVECSSGASTIVLAKCAKQNGNGHVYSLEHDPVYAQKTRAELAKHGLDAWASVIDAPLQEYQFEGRTYHWYKLPASILAMKIDMLIIDGPPGILNKWARYPAGPLLFPTLNVNSVVFLDDSNRPEEQDIVKRWSVEFPALSITQHACEKGAASLRNTLVT